MRDRTRVVLLIGVAFMALTIVAVSAVLVATRIIGGFPKGLSQKEAERLLRSTRFMDEAVSTKLVLYKNLVLPATDLLAEHRDMVKFLDLGLVEVRPNTVWWSKPVGAKFELTAEGERAAAAGWQHTAGSGGEEAWLVPTARKELILVLKPVTQEEAAECAFTWKWAPNKIGEKIGIPKATESYSVRFHRQGDRWNLDESSIMQAR
jgi:hypothetical protein